MVQTAREAPDGARRFPRNASTTDPIQTPTRRAADPIQTPQYSATRGALGLEKSTARRRIESHVSTCVRTVMSQSGQGSAWGLNSRLQRETAISLFFANLRKATTDNYSGFGTLSTPCEPNPNNVKGRGKTVRKTRRKLEGTENERRQPNNF